MPFETEQARLAPLRERIAPWHDALERRLDIFGALGSARSYRALLACFYGIYAPLEDELAEAIVHWGVPLDWESRRKAHLLARDLHELGLPPASVAALPRCTDLPPLDGRPAVFGCLYVIEGATLGGQVIARQLARRSPDGAASVAAFFTSYGPSTGAMWRAFCTQLARELGAPEAEHAVPAAAIATFTAFDRWLSERVVET